MTGSDLDVVKLTTLSKFGSNFFNVGPEIRLVLITHIIYMLSNDLSHPLAL